jgi:hypothetical protein
MLLGMVVCSLVTGCSLVREAIPQGLGPFPSLDVVPLADATDVPTDGDIPDLPPVPGARRTERARDRDDGLVVLEVVYAVDADIETVRRHYRRVMQEHGWRVGDTEVSDDGWELEASKGSREVEIEIESASGGTRVEVSLTDLASPAPRP